MVRLADVVEALEMVGDGVRAYASRRTGEVRVVTDEDLQYAEMDRDTGELPEWQRDVIVEAREVLESAEWLSLPTSAEIHEWAIMDQFARALPDPVQRDGVLDAIHGSGAFRRFKRTVRELGIEPLWFAHRARAFEEIARAWLREHDLEST